MDKGYFIALPEGHDESVYLNHVKIIKSVSGATKPHPEHSSGTKYLVVRPFEARTVKWGSLETALRKLRKDPNMVELSIYGENV